MKYLIDNQLPPALAQHLRAYGLKSTHVADVALDRPNPTFFDPIPHGRRKSRGSPVTYGLRILSSLVELPTLSHWNYFTCAKPNSPIGTRGIQP